MLEKNHFKSRIEAVGAMFGVKVDRELLTLYYSVLRDMHPLEFDASVKYILENNVYPSIPRPAEFLNNKMALSYKWGIAMFKRWGWNEDQIIMQLNSDSAIPLFPKNVVK